MLSPAWVALVMGLKFRLHTTLLGIMVLWRGETREGQAWGWINKNAGTLPGRWKSPALSRFRPLIPWGCPFPKISKWSVARMIEMVNRAGRMAIHSLWLNLFTYSPLLLAFTALVCFWFQHFCARTCYACCGWKKKIVDAAQSWAQKIAHVWYYSHPQKGKNVNHY